MSRPEFQALVDSLKVTLKGKGMTYAKTSKKTRLSEATLKRLFAGRECNINHIFKICDAVGISFFDLASMAAEEKLNAQTLTEEQEQYFADDLDAYACLCHLIDGRNSTEVQNILKLSDSRMRTILKMLEQLGLLERKAGNKVSVKISGAVHWQENGLLVKRFYQRIGHDILEKSFTRRDNPNVTYHAASVELSKDSTAELKKDIDELVMKFLKKAHRDKTLLPKSELKRIGWALGSTEYSTDWSHIGKKKWP